MPIILNCVQHENAAVIDFNITKHLLCVLFVCKPAGPRRFPWSLMVRRKPGCFTSLVDVTWSSAETRKPENLASARSPPPMKFLKKNGRSWQLFWFHKRNVNIILQPLSFLCHQICLFCNVDLLKFVQVYLNLIVQKSAFCLFSKTWKLWIKCLLLRKGAEPRQAAGWWWPFHVGWHSEGTWSDSIYLCLFLNRFLMEGVSIAALSLFCS